MTIVCNGLISYVLTDMEDHVFGWDRINLRDSNPVRGEMSIESAHKQYL